MNWGDSVRSAPPGRFGLWFSAACELQSCGTSSWANNIVLSGTSCSPLAQNGSGRPVSESVLTWNCSALCAEQVSERREERTAHMSLRFVCIYLHFPLSCSQFWEACKQTPCSNPVQDSTGAHHSQHFQWGLVKSLRWGRGFAWDLSHLGLIVQTWTVVIEVEKKRGLHLSQCKYTWAHFSMCLTSLFLRAWVPDRIHI